MIPRRAKPVRNPLSRFIANKEARDEFNWLMFRRANVLQCDLRTILEARLREMFSTPTIVITDEGAGEPETDVPAHLARLQ